MTGSSRTTVSSKVWARSTSGSGELGVADLVGGQTDSERVFALITAAVRAHGGDVGAAIVDAIGWLAGNVPIYAVNLLLSTATDMWALRYPDTHEL